MERCPRTARRKLYTPCLKELAAIVQDGSEFAEILAGLYLRLDQLFVARPSSLFRAASVLLHQSLQSRLSVSRSFPRRLAFEFLDGFVRRTRCLRKKNAPAILVYLFPRFLGNDVKRGGVANAGKRRWGLALKQVEDGLAVEHKEDSNLALVLREAFFTPASEGQATSSMATSRYSAEITNPSLCWAPGKK